VRNGRTAGLASSSRRDRDRRLPSIGCLRDCLAIGKRQHLSNRTEVGSWIVADFLGKLGYESDVNDVNARVVADVGKGHVAVSCTPIHNNI
jgi:hypothetical protein